MAKIVIETSDQLKADVKKACAANGVTLKCVVEYYLNYYVEENNVKGSQE